MAKKIKILQVLHGGPAFGGVESFLVDRYKLMDIDRIQLDFAFALSDNMGIVREEEMFKNSSFFPFDALQPGTENIKYLTFYKKLRELCREKQYDVIHIHSGSVFMQFFSYLSIRNNRPKAWIVHAHHANSIVKGKQLNNYSGVMKFIGPLIVPLFKKVVCKNATCMFACSEEAGKHAFGREICNSKFEILKNGIDLERFAFDPDVRDKLRKETKTQEKTVFGLTGRINNQKNPSFAIEVFHAIHERNPDTVLWIVGNGILRTEMEEKVKAFSLQDSVVFWGERSDVDRLMQAMDALLFPSIYEGLGIVAIEAQSVGIPVFASDCIPRDAGCTELMYFWPLDTGAQYWATQIEKTLSQLSQRRGREDELRAVGYDINDCASRLENIYDKITE